MNLRCVGAGAPTVVFESGLGGAGWEWALIHTVVARHARACVYDRAGFGFSDPSHRPGTALNAAEDLEALLRGADVKPPYVLVGASYGAMIVRLFAAQRPQEVAGLVLVDGHHEDELDRIDKLSSGKYRPMMASLERDARDCRTAAHRQIQPASEEFKTCIAPPPSFANRALAAAHLAQMLSATYWDSALSEREHLDTTSASQLRSANRGLGDKPVLALVRSVSPFDTPGKKPSALSMAVEKENERMQQEAAMHSRAGRSRVIPRAGHDIQLDQPSAVTAAVVEIVELSRR